MDYNRLFKYRRFDFMKEYKFNYVYKITNLINGKIYIGVHSTDDLNDQYMGSGKLIRLAISKYGILNFKKEILEYCSSRKSVFLKEAELVDADFVKRIDTYNISFGGRSGINFYWDDPILREIHMNRLKAFNKKLCEENRSPFTLLNDQQVNFREQRRLEALRTEEYREFSSKKFTKMWAEDFTKEERSRIGHKSTETSKKNGTFDKRKTVGKESGIHKKSDRKYHSIKEELDRLVLSTDLPDTVIRKHLNKKYNDRFDISWMRSWREDLTGGHKEIVFSQFAGFEGLNKTIKTVFDQTKTIYFYKRLRLDYLLDFELVFSLLSDLRYSNSELSHKGNTGISNLVSKVRYFEYLGLIKKGDDIIIDLRQLSPISQRHYGVKTLYSKVENFIQNYILIKEDGSIDEQYSLAFNGEFIQTTRI